MDTTFWWTGAVVWALFSLAALWLLVEWFVGIATSLSYGRWCVKNAEKFIWHKHAHKLAWMVLSGSFTEFYAYRNTGDYVVTHQGSGAIWRGIGDWT